MLDFDGAILCEALFWYELAGGCHARFPKAKSSQRVRNTPDDAVIESRQPGTSA
jgi:hypothetical protein